MKGKSRVTKPKVVLVLSAGAISGVAHLGVLAVLEEAGIAIDAIVGSSVGSLVGLLYAQEGSAEGALEMLERWWPRGYQYGLFGLPHVQRGLRGHGFFSMDGVRAFFERHIRFGRLEDLPMRVYMTAARLRDGEVVLFSKGSTLDALCASVAIPIFFTPVEVGGERYSDGAVVTALPVHKAKRLRGDVVIASDVSINLAKANYLDVAWFKFWGMAQRRTAREECALADVVLRPGMKFPPGLLNRGDDMRAMYVSGRRVAKRHLGRIREAIARAKG